MPQFISSIYNIPGLAQLEKELAFMRIKTLETNILLHQYYLHLMLQDTYLKSAFTQQAMLLEINPPANYIDTAVPDSSTAAPTATVAANPSWKSLNANLASTESPSMFVDNNNNIAAPSIANQPEKVKQEPITQPADSELAVDTAVNYYLHARENSNMMKYFNM